MVIILVNLICIKTNRQVSYHSAVRVYSLLSFLSFAVTIAILPSERRLFSLALLAIEKCEEKQINQPDIILNISKYKIKRNVLIFVTV